MNPFKMITQRISSAKKSNEYQNHWRRCNEHNYTTISQSFPEKISPECVVDVGKGTYGHIDIKWFWSDEEHLSIGNYCSIAGGVKFLTGGNHHLDRLSSYPFAHYYKIDENNIAPTKGPIIIHDDVWIGMDSIILSGVTIGQGAVIGAGSVVAKDVPPYAIYVGNKVVKYRFSDQIIEKLLLFDFSSLSEDDIIKNGNILNKELTEDFFDSAFYHAHIKS